MNIELSEGNGTIICDYSELIRVFIIRFTRQSKVNVTRLVAHDYQPIKESKGTSNGLYVSLEDLFQCSSSAKKGTHTQTQNGVDALLCCWPKVVCWF